MRVLPLVYVDHFLVTQLIFPKFSLHVNMPPKRNLADTPSPSKKRKTETTPVKRGVDFFFKKQIQEQALPAPASNGSDAKLFIDSAGEDEDVKRIRQQEEDERLARELQEMEGMQQVDDEEFAKKLARDYETLDRETKDGGYGKGEVK